jgi:hypothetical protein
MTVTLKQLQVKARSQRFSFRHFPLIRLLAAEINKAALLNENGSSPPFFSTPSRRETCASPLRDFLASFFRIEEEVLFVMSGIFMAV